MGRPKDRVEQLAICGGTPAFSGPLHVGRPNIGDQDRFLARLKSVLESRVLTNNGAYVQELERRICEFLGVGNCVAVCNGTIALEITARALGLTGEVLIPSFTFIATAHALQWQGLIPAFCDIDPATHNLDPRDVEKKITARTSGLLGVHIWGRPCPVDELAEVARRHHLKLWFDAAHAFGCSSGGTMIGNFGEAEVLSFHATKFFNTFEGGAVVTNDDELARRVRLMTNFGFTGYDQVSVLGTNGKMTEIAAAMGLTGLESLAEVVAVNERNYRRYRAALKDVPGITLQAYDDRERNNYQYVVLEVRAERTSLTRDQLVRVLQAENVLARRYFHPGCHRMEPYLTLDPQAGTRLPQTEVLTQRVVVLPTGTAVSEEDVAGICGIIRLAVEHGPFLSKFLADH
jgi:dTDP-4-amino-4,6-dideoxygalactose transaminase